MLHKKDMNNLKVIRRRIGMNDIRTFSWDLFTFHAQIGLMEFILHLAHRL